MAKLAGEPSKEEASPCVKVVYFVPHLVDRDGGALHAGRRPRLGRAPLGGPLLHRGGHGRLVVVGMRALPVGETAVSKADQKRFSKRRTPQAWMSSRVESTASPDALRARRWGLVNGGPEVGLSAVCAWWCGMRWIEEGERPNHQFDPFNRSTPARGKGARRVRTISKNGSRWFRKRI